MAVCRVGWLDEILTILLTPPVPSKGKWCSARLYPTSLRFCALRTALMRLEAAAVSSAPSALHPIRFFIPALPAV